MGIIIHESDMIFGEYNETDCFQIEKSVLYQKNLMPKGAKVTEFILFRKGKLLLVEAKKSTPDYAHQSAENKKDCEERISEIVTKFSNTLSTYFSMRLGRQPSDELPKIMQELDCQTLRPVLVLVVKNGYKGSLDPLRGLLKRSIDPTLKIWNIIDDIIVLDEEMAIKKRLVLPQAPAT